MSTTLPSWIILGLLASGAVPTSASAQGGAVVDLERLHERAQAAAALSDDASRELAIQLWSQMAEESARRSDRVREGVAVNNIGRVEFQRGRFEVALEMFDRATMLAMAGGHVSNQLNALYNAGRVLEHLDRISEALDQYEQAALLLEGNEDRRIMRTEVLGRIEKLKDQGLPDSR